MSHDFTVQEICTNSDDGVNSPQSSVSQDASTLHPATSPYTVYAALGTPGDSSMALSWIAGDANDCIFDSWLVEFASGSTGVPTGCSDLTDRSVTECDVSGLTDSTYYSFTVTETCSNSHVDSPTSVASAAVSTFFPADAPTSVTASTPTSDSLELVWTSGDANDCLFDTWSVVYVDGDLSGTVAGCTTFASRSVVSCTASGLTSGVSYSFSVTESCVNAADSEASATSAAVTTLLPATAPTNALAETSSDESLEFSWTAGSANDCIFSHWLVELASGGTGE